MAGIELSWKRVKGVIVHKVVANISITLLVSFETFIYTQNPQKTPLPHSTDNTVVKASYSTLSTNS
jgi:hypothetical protein